MVKELCVIIKRRFGGGVSCCQGGTCGAAHFKTAPQKPLSHFESVGSYIHQNIHLHLTLDDQRPWETALKVANKSNSVQYKGATLSVSLQPPCCVLFTLQPAHISQRRCRNKICVESVYQRCQGTKYKYFITLEILGIDTLLE